ncbi:hypothetical protein BTW08_17970 [Salinicola sp. MH3R3-1]|uniref:DUF3465 domain-containing protein n=1 Tax=Salinicola sp. MH3R3-1 TaxID=1928762 RepID=UPI00094E8577|nr:DUF3465 domain-containing protein [Salinicola sp. MH3R3-1]OLO06352.1 hypothetical protein BTW08_17970 [Salinicola sp. MH3R3-1]
MRQSGFRRYRWVLVGLLVLAAVTPLVKQLGGAGGLFPSSVPGSDTGDGVASQSRAETTLKHAFETHREAFWIEAAGRVERVLADDREGSRHQRIIVALATGQTLLVAHNIDVAPRLASIAPGDRLRFRGEYVWNAQGGVIHWTHHDPGGERPGGWLELDGRRYR